MKDEKLWREYYKKVILDTLKKKKQKPTPILIKQEAKKLLTELIVIDTKLGQVFYK